MTNYLVNKNDLHLSYNILVAKNTSIICLKNNNFIFPQSVLELIVKYSFFELLQS